MDAEQVVGPANGENASPLADLFPGKTVRLSDGRLLTVGGKVLTVYKWTARQVVREIPAILGDVLVKLSTLAQAGLTSTNAIASTLIVDAAEQIVDLVAMSAKVEKASLDDIGADELVALVRTVVEVNWSFFDEITRLYELTRTRLASSGTGSR